MSKDDDRIEIASSMRELTALLADVEDAPDGSGALMFGDDAAAGCAVLVDRRRICWILAPGGRRRLVSAIRALAARPVTDAEIAEIAIACRASGRSPLVALADHGVLRPCDVAEVARRYISSSLASRLGRDLGDHAWRAHATGGFGSIVSLRPVDVLAAVGAHLFPDQAAIARSTSLDRGWPSSAYVVTGAGAVVPVHWSGDASLRARDLAELGGWAVGALSSPPATADSLDTAVRAAEAGMGLAVTWQEEPGVVRAVSAAAVDLAPVVAGLVADLARVEVACLPAALPCME